VINQARFRILAQISDKTMIVVRLRVGRRRDVC